MIRRLELRNFKGVERGGVELSPLTILVGPNNSGKTTILEALFLAPNPFRTVPYVREGKTEPVMAAELIHLLHKTLESEGYVFLLRNYTADEAKISWDEISLTFVKQNERIAVKFSKYIEQAMQEGVWEIGYLPTRSSKIDFSEVKFRRDLLSEDALLFSPAILSRFGFEYLRQNWTPIVNSGVCRRVAREVSELVQEEYMDLTMEPFLGALSINVYLRDGRRIRLGDLGEGVQNYIVARILYESGNYKVLLWDDIEAHMNPTMLMAVAEWFSDLVEKGDQVILTTHSLEATRVIASIAGDKCSICLTSLENGVLNSRKLSLAEVEKLIEAGVDIRSTAGLLV